MQNPLNRFTMRFDPEGMTLHLESEENKTFGLNSYWRTTRMGTSESLCSVPLERSAGGSTRTGSKSIAPD